MNRMKALGTLMFNPDPSQLFFHCKPIFNSPLNDSWMLIHDIFKMFSLIFHRWCGIKEGTPDRLKGAAAWT